MEIVAPGCKLWSFTGFAVMNEKSEEQTNVMIKLAPVSMTSQSLVTAVVHCSDFEEVLLVGVR